MSSASCARSRNWGRNRDSKDESPSAGGVGCGEVDVESRGVVEQRRALPGVEEHAVRVRVDPEGQSVLTADAGTAGGVLDLNSDGDHGRAAMQAGFYKGFSSCRSTAPAEPWWQKSCAPPPPSRKWHASCDFTLGMSSPLGVGLNARNGVPRCSVPRSGGLGAKILVSRSSPDAEDRDRLRRKYDSVT